MNKLLLAGLLAAATITAHAEVATYAIDPSHTFVTFEVTHSGTSTLRGRFDRKDGLITLDKAGKTGKAEVTIDATSASTGVASLDGALKGKNLFNAAEFASMKFSADKFTFSGDKVSEIAGTLTLLGKTQPVTLKATNFNCYMSPFVQREVCGGDFETTLVRSQYGMTYSQNFISDNVHLLIQIEAIKQ